MTSAVRRSEPGPPAPHPGWTLQCASCGTTYPYEHSKRCTGCGGPVLKERSGQMARGVDGTRTGIWRYAERLGLDPSLDRLSLGESMTPLLRDDRLATSLGIGQVWLKLESLCPTGSFKDRAVAAGVAHAVGAGSEGIVCASSGNAAASAAAYAARAGLPAVLVMPEITPPGKLASSAAYGAYQVLAPGDYSSSFALAEELAVDSRYTNVTTTYLNPHGVSGLRSVAYDLADQLPQPATAVVVPTSAGPLVHGVGRGYDDLLRAGLVDRVPRLVAAQPAGCSPVAAAFTHGLETVEPWLRVETSVSGLDDPLRGYQDDGTVTLQEVRRSGGHAVALEDDVIDRARLDLAQGSGVFVEPAGATSVAALEHLVVQKVLGPDDTVVCLLTGHGMKRVPEGGAEPIRAATSEEVRSALAARGWM